MYHVNQFYAGSSLRDVAEWANESKVKIVAIEFAPTGMINVLYEARE